MYVPQGLNGTKASAFDWHGERVEQNWMILKTWNEFEGVNSQIKNEGNMPKFVASTVYVTLVSSKHSMARLLCISGQGCFGQILP